MVVETVSEHVSDSNASLKDVNIALRNNFAILESLDKSDPKRDEIKAENEKLLNLGFEVIAKRGLQWIILKIKEIILVYLCLYLDHLLNTQ